MASDLLEPGAGGLTVGDVRVRVLELEQKGDQVSDTSHAARADAQVQAATEPCGHQFHIRVTATHAVEHKLRIWVRDVEVAKSPFTLQVQDQSLKVSQSFQISLHDDYPEYDAIFRLFMICLVAFKQMADDPRNSTLRCQNCPSNQAYAAVLCQSCNESGEGFLLCARCDAVTHSEYNRAMARHSRSPLIEFQEGTFLSSSTGMSSLLQNGILLTLAAVFNIFSTISCEMLALRS
jgi:hypothetical protein